MSVLVSSYSLFVAVVNKRTIRKMGIPIEKTMNDRHARMTDGSDD